MSYIKKKLNILCDNYGKALKFNNFALSIPPPTKSLTIISPSSYTLYQRNSSDSATISIIGTYNGPLGNGIEACFGNEAWETLSASSNIFTGSFVREKGQYTLKVRFKGFPESETASYYVGIGDLFALIGQSNGSGRGINNQSYSHPTLKAHLFKNDYTWGDLIDPIDSNSGQVDSVSSDNDLQMGSIWPLVSTIWLETVGHPIGFVPCCKGSTSFSPSGPPNWTVPSNHFDRTTLFGSAAYRIQQVGGVRACLWWQGEGGWDNTAIPNAWYYSAYTTMTSTLASEFPGLKTMPCKLQYLIADDQTTMDTRQRNVWNTIGYIWANDVNSIEGPTLADYPEPPEGNITTDDEGGSIWYHLKEDSKLQAAAERWAAKLISNFQSTPT